jgi:hypothetical protein
MSTALVKWATGIAEQTLLDSACQAAKSATASISRVVVQNDDDARIVGDAAGAAKKGRLVAQKVLKEQIEAPLKEAMKEGGDGLREFIAACTGLETAVKDAIGAYLRDKERKQKVAEQAERDRAAAAEKAAKEEAALTGMSFVPPPPALPAVDLGDRSAYSGKPMVKAATAAFHLTTVLCVELVDPVAAVAFSSDFVKPNEARVKEAVRYYRKDGVLEGSEPHPAGGVLWHGYRVWDDSGTAQR